jgi:hypothetical protein
MTLEKMLETGAVQYLGENAITGRIVVKVMGNTYQKSGFASILKHRYNGDRVAPGIWLVEF